MLEAQPPERPKHAYAPFGGGARHCIGHGFAKMEVVFTLAVTRFKAILGHSSESLTHEETTAVGAWLAEARRGAILIEEGSVEPEQRMLRRQFCQERMVYSG